MDHLKKLFITNGDKISSLKADNYLLSQDEAPVKKFSDQYFSLGQKRIYEIQQAITKAHCEHEMNFQIKDENGQYNKVAATPFHGFAPIKKSYIEELVRSTTPLLEITKRLLQNLFSKNEITEKSLQIEHIPTKEARELISIIQNNIYFEPKLRHPNLETYPFLSIVGFDSAIANLKFCENIFFEFNAGTPCGIEDQYQLFYHFKNIAPELANFITPFMSKDRSHELLKNTIDKCALNWTGIKNGISVVLSPGSYNPAHPEIACLARRSQMPLVKMQDLYIDEYGYVRLMTSEDDDPVVTGIYNRKEESFLTYSEKLNIPLRSPFTIQNKQLSKKYNVELKEGVLYSYKYDEDFNIIGIDIDKISGKAKYQTLFDKISPAPDHDMPGDIMQAVWDKKLFISNLGGRVLDDKRAFRIIYDHLITDKKNTAHPPKSIATKDLEYMFEKAVIKAPNLSGGAGVLIGAQANEKEKNEIFKLISEQPDYYETQELSNLAVINTVSPDHGDDLLNTIPLPADWRLIIFSSPNEKPILSTHSCLVRTAPYGSIKTNTSSGGGYALGLIYNDEVQNANNHISIQTPSLKIIAKSRLLDAKNFTSNIEKLIESGDKTQLENLIYQLRDLIDIIGPEHITWINYLRKLQSGKIDLTEFAKSYQDFIEISELKNIISV